MRNAICLLITSIALLPMGATAQDNASGVPSARPAAPAENAGRFFRQRIAVLKMESPTAAAQYGDVGAGLAAQLTTALMNSGQFIVVERADLANVLREQEMGAKGLVTAGTAAHAGQLTGVQYLIRATVTEFEQQSGGGGLRLGFGIPLGKTGLGTATSTGVVGIDVRVIDATSGQVVLSRHVEGKIEDRAISADVEVKHLTFGGDSFDKTPLGRASRMAVEQATDYLVTSAKALPWTAAVAQVDGERVYVNAGADAGLRPGDRFMIVSTGAELTDPATGARLGSVETPIGEIDIVSVQPAFAVARMITPFFPKRGDAVRPAERGS